MQPTTNPVMVNTSCAMSFSPSDMAAEDEGSGGDMGRIRIRVRVRVRVWVRVWVRVRVRVRVRVLGLGSGLRLGLAWDQSVGVSGRPLGSGS